MAAAAEAARAGVDALAEAWAGFTRSHFQPPADAEPRDHCWASSFRDCTRRMALDLMHPEIGRDFDDSSMEAMLRGREREAAVNARLHQLAARAVPRFEVVEGQSHFTIRGRADQVLVTGKIDGRLVWRDGPATGQRPIFEVKSGRSIEHCETLSDLDRGRWTRHYADQLLLYLFARDEPWGLLILDRSRGPAWVPLVLEDHLERVERRLQQAETAIEARFERSRLPAFHEDAGECRRCPHLGRTCSPPMLSGEGLRVIADPVLESCARVIAVNGEAHREYERAKKALAAATRGAPHVLVGDYLVTGKWGISSRLELPDEIAKRRQAEDEEHRVTIEEGKWYMDVKPLEGTPEVDLAPALEASIAAARSVS